MFRLPRSIADVRDEARNATPRSLPVVLSSRRGLTGNVDNGAAARQFDLSKLKFIAGVARAVIW